MSSCIGCGDELECGMACCDRCWFRAPDDLPGFPGWRFRLRAAVRDGDWSANQKADSIHYELQRWLKVNPAD